MGADIFAWLVPLALATFAVVFFTLRFHGLGSFWWGTAFSLIAFAFGSSLVPVEDSAVLKPLVEDTAFIGAFVCFVHGTCGRLGCRVRKPLVYGVAIVGILAAAASLLVWSSVRAELVFVQATGAIVLLETARGMRGRLRHAPDRMFYGLTLAFAANLVVQNLSIAFLADASMTVATWAQSPWGFALQASGATAGILFAVLILFIIGRDLVDTLRTMSETDPLSGVANRRGFDARSQATRRETAGRAPVGLIVFDIDHFKQVNDLHGHACGDMVICAVAQMAVEMAGPRGIVGRLGGEEFAILVPGIGLKETHDLAEAMRGALRTVRWPHPMGDLALSASFGATGVGREELLGDAVQRADRMLYIAKNRGRDQVLSCASGSRIVPPETEESGHAGGVARPVSTDVAA